MALAEPMMPADLAPDEPLPPQTTTRDSISSLGMSTDEEELEEDVRTSTQSLGPPPETKTGWRKRLHLGGLARRTLGISLLLVTVFLWTLSNFLASSIFSDGEYDKPFFVVYMNTSVFAISMIPLTIRYVWQHGFDALRAGAVRAWQEQKHGKASLKMGMEDDDVRAGERLLGGGGDEDLNGSLEMLDQSSQHDVSSAAAAKGGGSDKEDEEKLTFRETAILSLEFSMLWFLANYFASACLQYTSVSSATILTSTSSIWTLIFCALMKVEGFTARKLMGVLASLAGVILISTVDLTGSGDENNGSFPHKSLSQIAIGDSMAFISAIVYGLYVTVMKRKVGNEDRVYMPLFFGLVGLYNLLLLWPLFIILHVSTVEPFEMPPTGKVWAVIVANSLSSFVSDISWAYAMLLTTPLVVTVGLSLTIPLSLIGQMIQYQQYAGIIYWIGAAIVFMSFLFVNHESREDGGQQQHQRHPPAQEDSGVAV